MTSSRVQSCRTSATAEACQTELRNGSDALPPAASNVRKLIHAAVRLSGPVGEAAAGGQDVWVLGAQDPLGTGQQFGVLVAGDGVAQAARRRRYPDVPYGTVMAQRGLGVKGLPCLRLDAYQCLPGRMWSGAVAFCPILENGRDC
jgi:hypothetical protein